MGLEISENMRFTLAPGIIVTELEGEAVLLDSQNGQYFGLNTSGCDVLRLVQKNQSFKSIEQHLLNEYPEHPKEVTADLLQLLEKLLSQKLIISQ